MDQESTAALKILDRCCEEARAGAAEGQGETGLKYLVGICSSIVRVSSLIKPLKGGVDEHLGFDSHFTYDLDVLAFSMAVDSALFFELSCKDDRDSDNTRGWVCLTLTAAAHLLPALEEISMRLKRVGRKKDDLVDSINSAAQILRRLRDRLRFLCSSWIVAEALSLAADARIRIRRGVGQNL
jgi:hypothetical protein